MSSKILTEKEIVFHHLTLLKEHDKNTNIFSSLIAALRDARQATGRDLETGINPNRQNNSKQANWLGTLCYLIVLDQLGKCYKAKTDETLDNFNPIQRCLKQNTKLTNWEINAIYALRNALAHDYSISNRNNKDSTLRHHFTLLGYYSDPWIKLPSEIWDGEVNTKSEHNMTFIGLPWIGEIVESIYITILNLFHQNNLDIIINGGATEIQNRYLLFSTK